MMIRIRLARFAILGAIGVTTLAGCGAPQNSTNQQSMSVFKPPRMPPVPTYVPTPIDAPLQVKALNEIAAASRSPDEVMRAQSLEALSRTKDVNPDDRVAHALADKAWIVRYAGAMCAGDLKVKSAYKALLAMAYDQQPGVRVAVRYALHQLGDKSLTKDLEPLATNPDPHVRASVATVIGLLKEPTGTRVVRPMLGDADFTVRIEAAEALWRLGDEDGLKNLIAGTISPYPDEQIVSILALAAPRDQRVKDNIVGKLAEDKDGKQYLELQLAAARAAGMLGGNQGFGDEGFGVAIKAMNSADQRQRSLAAFALGEIGRPDGQSALGKALSDPVPEVRLSAAVALRQIELKSRQIPVAP